MAERLKVKLDPHEASIMELPIDPISRLIELGRLASYLEHDHNLPPLTRRGLVKRAEEHKKNTSQVGSIGFY